MADSNVIRLADYRTEPPAHAAWQADIDYCCRYARVLQTEHDAEKARLALKCKQRGIDFWWEGPQDIIDRINANNEEWVRYRALLRHIAAIPAANRADAVKKRAVIGKLWLRGESEYSRGLRASCEADDHLFPPSGRLAKAPRHDRRETEAKRVKAIVRHRVRVKPNCCVSDRLGR